MLDVFLTRFLVLSESVPRIISFFSGREVGCLVQVAVQHPARNIVKYTNNSTINISQVRHV